MNGEDDSSDDEVTRLEILVTVTVTSVTLAVGLGLLAVGVAPFWIVFVVGFAGVLPMALAAASLYEERQDGPSGGSSDSEREAEDALAELRQRYARGELSELEFERRVERLLETETIDDARRYVGTNDERVTTGRRRASDRNRTRDQRRGRDRSRDLGQDHDGTRDRNRDREPADEQR
ncbi:SHOCT domain-containing protein [Natrarchaeobaculum aegyptiacum]|uniref:SHOCT domain-containing protein n=1 Tax=Natrarchaeobaculum aegyptiacum TaxID=745377 RepID=A0A2Z2HV08_9EURY|nr:SHOCT domain-containing protein [Natrarchaeobaculum aegyptiacum]ARS89357.1 hypothetical protein B1756_06075 [Natrarchaeobaculum aegyptiacum]